MSQNTMSRAEELEYADWILELRQRANYTKQKHANEHWHRLAERVAHVLGMGDPDAGRRGFGPRSGAHAAPIAQPRA